MYVFVSVLGTFAVVVGFFALATLILRHKSGLIFDIYPRKGLFYHLKYVIALLVVKHLRHKLYKKEEPKTTQSNEEMLDRLDQPKQLSDNPNSYDVVSFMAANEQGQKLLITLERRRRGILKACMCLWLSGEEGLLCSSNLPDMLNFTTEEGQENDEFRGVGFQLYPEQCMRHWIIHYDGELRQVSESNKLLPVRLRLRFDSPVEYFDFNKDLSASVVADSIAREAWNDAFYSMLKNADQVLEQRVHFEQNGILQGELCIGGDRLVPLKMRGFKDRSFGTERCLSTINRYVFLALFLEDGTNMVIGTVSQPSFFLSSLKMGYVCTSEGLYKPIRACNFELYTYGQKGTPPKHQNFMVYTAEQKYFVQVKVDDTALRYLGGNWESKVFNQFLCCKVNGVQGYGIGEYLYRNSGGRPESVSTKDPEWYQRMRNFESSLSRSELFDDNEEFFF